MSISVRHGRENDLGPGLSLGLGWIQSAGSGKVGRGLHLTRGTSPNENRVFKSGALETGSSREVLYPNPFHPLYCTDFCPLVMEALAPNSLLKEEERAGGGGGEMFLRQEILTFKYL